MHYSNPTWHVTFADTERQLTIIGSMRTLAITIRCHYDNRWHVINANLSCSMNISRSCIPKTGNVQRTSQRCKLNNNYK